MEVTYRVALEVAYHEALVRRAYFELFPPNPSSNPKTLASNRG